MLDKMYYINLGVVNDNRYDHVNSERRRITENIFLQSGLMVERVEGVWGGGAGKGFIGCRLSHLKAIKQARDAKLESVLIFEDDILLHKDFVIELERVRREISGLEWDMVFFHGARAPYQNASESLVYGKAPIQAHCYGVHSRAFDLLIDIINKSNAPIDVLYSQLPIKVVIHKKNIAAQRSGLSIIDNMMKTRPIVNVTATSISDKFTRYKKVCANASEDETIKSFKSNPDYTAILEHVSENLGRQYLTHISDEYNYLLHNIELFKTNDLIGSPKIYEYGKFGHISPTTLRYIKTLGDLVKYFGNLDDLSVVEVGGGYGGQCLILNKAFKIKKYILVDLPQVIRLQRRYLSMHNIENVTYLDGDTIKNKLSCDLFISNYAFSECNITAQNNYIVNIINQSKMGYMLYNFISDRFDVRSLDVQELSTAVTHNINVLAERPCTNSNNRMIIWNDGCDGFPK